MAGDVASCHAQPGRMALGCKWRGVVVDGWRVRGRRPRLASRRGGRGARRRGLKKAEPGVWWAEWCVLFFFFHLSSFFFLCPPLVFCERPLQSVDVDGMSADRVQGARLVFSSACIVCIISSRCLAKALII